MSKRASRVESLIFFLPICFYIRLLLLPLISVYFSYENEITGELYLILKDLLFKLGNLKSVAKEREREISPKIVKQQRIYANTGQVRDKKLTYVMDRF